MKKSMTEWRWYRLTPSRDSIFCTDAINTVSEKVAGENLGTDGKISDGRTETFQRVGRKSFCTDGRTEKLCRRTDGRNIFQTDGRKTNSNSGRADEKTSDGWRSDGKHSGRQICDGANAKFSQHYPKKDLEILCCPSKST